MRTPITEFDPLTNCARGWLGTLSDQFHGEWCPLKSRGRFESPSEQWNAVYYKTKCCF